MDVLPESVQEISEAMDVLPESVQASTASKLDNRKFHAQLVEMQKGLVNILFFLLTLYFLMYMIFSMWPLLAGFLGLYYLKNGLHFNPRELLDVLAKVGVFVIDLCVNIMVQIMRFVMTF